jgi:hypothetical protein
MLRNLRNRLEGNQPQDESNPSQLIDVDNKPDPMSVGDLIDFSDKSKQEEQQQLDQIS